jgi:hypothetical protein
MEGEQAMMKVNVALNQCHPERSEGPAFATSR